MKIIRWTHKKWNLYISNRINSWSQEHPQREPVLVSVSRWATSRVMLHFSRRNNKKMADPEKNVHMWVFLKTDWETGLLQYAFNYHPAVIPLAFRALMEGDTRRSNTSQDLHIPLLFGTHWLIALHISLPSTWFICTRWLFFGLPE